jgi:hypothetical protein
MRAVVSVDEVNSWLTVVNAAIATSVHIDGQGENRCIGAF